jgi:hypothetical protein
MNNRSLARREYSLMNEEDNSLLKSIASRMIHISITHCEPNVKTPECFCSSFLNNWSIKYDRLKAQAHTCKWYVYFTLWFMQNRINRLDLCDIISQVIERDARVFPTTSCANPWWLLWRESISRNFESVREQSFLLAIPREDRFQSMVTGNNQVTLLLTAESCFGFNWCSRMLKARYIV